MFEWVGVGGVRMYLQYLCVEKYSIDLHSKPPQIIVCVFFDIYIAILDLIVRRAFENHLKNNQSRKVKYLVIPARSFAQKQKASF